MNAIDQIAANDNRIAEIERELDCAAVPERGHGFETECWRLHRYMDSIELVDIRDAGRRGRRCCRIVVSHYSDPIVSYEAAVSLCRLAREGAAVETVRAAVEALRARYPRACYHETAERGVDVAPYQEPKIIVRTAWLAIEITPRGFDGADPRDEWNGTRLMAYGRKSTWGRLYRWAVGHRPELEAMTFGDLCGQLGELGVDFHTWCSVD